MAGSAVGEGHLDAGVAHLALRRDLEPDRTAGQSPRVLTNDVGGYRLQVDDEHVDSRRFERLAEQIRDLAGGGEPRAALALCQEALDLWRGRPYETLADHELIAPIVSRLDELAAEVQERRVDALLAVGETEQALAAASSLLDATPFRERLWVQRMLGLYRLGRSEEALRVYQQARTVLIDEVGGRTGTGTTGSALADPAPGPDPDADRSDNRARSRRRPVDVRGAGSPRGAL